MPEALQAGKLSLSSIPAALREGAAVMRANPGISIAYAAIFALIGLAVALLLGGHMAPLTHADVVNPIIAALLRG